MVGVAGNSEHEELTTTDHAVATGARRREPSPRALLTLAWIAGFTLIDSSIVSLALPDIARDFDRSVAELAWVSTGFLLALAASLLAAGRLTDQFGSRRVTLTGAVAFLVTMVACAVAPTFELLVTARVAQGVAGGVLYTVSLAIASTAYPPERRATALSIYFTSGALGAVIGPVVGGVLTDLGGWPLVFWAQVPVPIAIWLLAFVLVPPPAESRRQPFDVPGVVAATVFMLAATYAVLQIPDLGAGRTVVLGGVMAVAALVAFVLIERRATAPVVRLTIFRNRRFVVSSVAGAGGWFAIMSGVVYTAIYLQLGRGMDASQAGVVLIAPAIVALAFLPFGGRTIGRLGADRAQVLGLVMLVGSAAMASGWRGGTAMWFVVLTLLLTGAGVAVTLVASATNALSQFGPAEAGTGSALFNSLRQLGAGMGVALPAVAFEIVAAGSRSSTAALDGSSAAFLLRFGVLCTPLLLILASQRYSRAA